MLFYLNNSPKILSGRNLDMEETKKENPALLTAFHLVPLAIPFIWNIPQLFA